MNRRESLIGLSALAAHALFGEVVQAYARAASAGDDDWQPTFVPRELGHLLGEVVDTILPPTDTPGAKAARVHVFVDLALARCVPLAGQAAVLAALRALHGRFVELPAPARLQRLRRVDPVALDLLEELTILGYFTSEIGATQALAYEAVPGAYHGCVDLKPGQKGWAT